MATLDNNYAMALLIAKSAQTSKVKMILREFNDLPVGLMGRVDSEIDELERKIKLLGS